MKKNLVVVLFRTLVASFILQCFQTLDMKDDPEDNDDDGSILYSLMTFSLRPSPPLFFISCLRHLA